MSLINENIEQMKLLINYNPKLTLTENRNVILEGGELSKILQVMGKDSKALLSAELSGLESVSKLVGKSKRFKTTEELLQSIQAGRINASDILKDVLKNPSKFANKFPEIYKSASSNYAHQLMNSKSELAIKFQNATPAERKELLQQSGYSKQAIEKITQEVRTIEKSNLKSGIDNQKIKSGTKESEALSKEKHISKNKNKFREYYNNGKGKITELKKNEWVRRGFLKKRGGLGKPVKWSITVRKILAWAAVAGVTYWILKKWLFDNDILPDEDVKKTDGGNNGGNNGGNQTTYQNCTSFPYKKGCEGTIISEVQKCLGLNADGKYGDDTVNGLKNKGYGDGTEITQDIYNKIMDKCKSKPITPTPTPTPTKLTYDQEYGLEPNPNQSEKGSGYQNISFDDIQ